jgi:hypothetical protein
MLREKKMHVMKAIFKRDKYGTLHPEKTKFYIGRPYQTPFAGCGSLNERPARRSYVKASKISEN